LRLQPRAWLLLGTLTWLTGCALQPEQPGVPATADHSDPTHPAEAADNEGPLPPKQDDLLPKLVLIDEPEETGGIQPVLPPPDSIGTIADAPPHDDLWGRIAAGFALPDHDHPRALRERTWLIKRPDYLDRVAERARPYLYLIAEAVETRGVPGEIALLPVVESAFQPFAYSRGRAAGLWQFIPSTGKNYGLKQNWWYDGRRDVLAATDAALDYLTRLSTMFDGDWLLALAAYNSGEGTVMRAMKRNRKAGKPTDYWSLKLPRETTAYVAKLLAVSDVFTHPEEFGLTIPSIDNRQVLTAVEIGGQIDLARAAELAEISIEEFYLYNPAFNRWATDPDGPHRLLVPVAQAERFEERIAALDDSDRLRWQRHRIRSGESLITIAMKYRTTPDVLRRVNRIDGDLIRAGHHLLIPGGGSADVIYQMPAEQRLAVLASQSLSKERRKRIHTVRSGESLWRIGRRYGVSIKQLTAWNNLSAKSTLRIGQKLAVWQPQKRNVPASAGVALAGTPRQLQTIRYIVRRGDSLWRVSRRFNVSIANLRTWNNLREGSTLQPGQKLTLRVDVTRQAQSSS